MHVLQGVHNVFEHERHSLMPILPSYIFPHLFLCKFILDIFFFTIELSPCQFQLELKQPFLFPFLHWRYCLFFTLSAFLYQCHEMTPSLFLFANLYGLRYVLHSSSNQELHGNYTFMSNHAHLKVLLSYLNDDIFQMSPLKLS